MSDRKIAIRVKCLSKQFGSQVVLRDVSFDVAPAQCVALIGPNGAGKTTLLRCLASVIRPTHGEVQWFHRPTTADPAARRLIGIVTHESRLYPHLTARENLVFAARMCDVRRPLQAADRWLKDLGLVLHADRLPGRLSSGMRQRLTVARALVHDPELLFLDEPFYSLDAEGVDWLLALLIDLRDRERAMCLVTHDPKIVARVADRVLELRSGRVREREVVRRAETSTHRPAARAA